LGDERAEPRRASFCWLLLSLQGSGRSRSWSRPWGPAKQGLKESFSIYIISIEREVFSTECGLQVVLRATPTD
jgi:hypothetical protein